MSWILGRFGSRFSLLFEPHHRRVMHSALGRFLDRPLDLKVGLIGTDGEARVMPFTRDGMVLDNLEQFERINSTTFRGYSAADGLRFEFNVHSVFYPENEGLCTMPAFYLELRVNPAPRYRRNEVESLPETVRLFIGVDRPETDVAASVGDQAAIDLAYDVDLAPDTGQPGIDPASTGRVSVQERIVSLNEGCEVNEAGNGLVLELPVTREGSGVKWRLVWGAYCGDPVMQVKTGGGSHQARLHYTDWWENVDEVLDEAIESRDYRLSLSRRFEKLIDETSLEQSERHLLHLGFQSMVTNAWWLNVEELNRQWFTVWEGSSLFHQTLDVAYNTSLFYLSLWPDLLRRMLIQRLDFWEAHEPSGGAYLPHDIGVGMEIGRQAFDVEMPVEENANFLLMLQAYAHFTADLEPVQEAGPLIEQLTRYLMWCDR
ncbi:MAG: DUF4965 domain-containing protein, partial [Phycisphaeraceae bacterium]|nr:DUF4965 domain-containing protein [Phycisphaeraceae bacterium]